MNYIREINSFYDWLETNMLTDSAIVLWHALMHISNRAGWPDEFAVAISTLSVKTGLKKDAIIRARLKLQQQGRIDFASRNGQLSAVYKIIPFSDYTEDCVGLSDTNRNAIRAQSATQTATQSEHKPRPLINKTKYTATTRAEPETVSDAYCRVFGKTIIPPNVSSFLVPIMQKHGERYAIELILETGEAANNPSLRYMQKTHEAWQERGVTSRSENATHRVQRSPPKPKSTTSALPLVTLTQEEAAELERIANAQRPV